jgi:hypothetical protein
MTCLNIVKRQMEQISMMMVLISGICASVVFVIGLVIMVAGSSLVFLADLCKELYSSLLPNGGNIDLKRTNEYFTSMKGVLGGYAMSQPFLRTLGMLLMKQLAISRSQTLSQHSIEQLSAKYLNL